MRLIFLDHTRQRLSTALLASLFTLMISACSDGGDSRPAAVTPLPINYAVTLSGDQENPPVLTVAAGSGSFALNTQSGVLTGSITTTGVTGTAAHLHIAPVGVNGAVSVPLVESTTGSGIWGVSPGTVLTTEQRVALGGGAMYANVHSAAFPGGQIRGQVGQVVRGATLSGSQENPPVATAAAGSGLIAVDPGTRALVARVTTSGITATAAHIHDGTVGANGAVIVPLTETAPGSGVWGSAANATFSEAQYAGLLAGTLYFNVHSAANPGGQIRGQIGVSVFDVAMSSAQEVPANASTASGLARIVLNRQNLTLNGTLTTSGMATTAAHIHTANFGSNGGVTFGFTQTLPGGSVWAMAPTVISTAQLQSLIFGDMYMNAHSATFPGGEVRGQIGNVIRTGNLSGTQEVPANTSTASGRGTGQFDPVTLAASFTVTSSVVSPTAAHIHTAPAGSNGGVTVGFTQTSPGTWTSAATATLTAAQAATFAAGGMYYNVHSAAFPGGEVRAQAVGRD